MPRLTWTALVLLACAEPIPPLPIPDGSIARDAGTRDAGPVPDAGPPQPVVDGVVTDAEWVRGETVRANIPTDRSGSTLTALRARVRSGRLFVAVEGSIAPGDAILIYVDRSLGTPDGTDTADLSDRDGTLDALISRTLDTPDNFRADFAWATQAMPHTSVGIDDNAGWRNLNNMPSAFTQIAAETAETVCSESACETSIPLGTLGGNAPRTIALFARLARGDGTLTNQSVPADSAATPSVITELLTVDDGTVVPDGGVDGGLDASVRMDGGFVPIRIDGVLMPGEWDAVPSYSTPASTVGTLYEGNALISLRAVRTRTQLAMALECAIAMDNAVVVYVDRDRGGGTGVFGGPTPFADFTGELDRAISKSLFTPGDINLDFAWGTTLLSHAQTDADPLMGWRDVDTASGAFDPIAISMSASVCGPLVCETTVDLGALGVRSTDTIALFARLVRVSGGAAPLSNQTIPHDDPGNPDIVSVLLALPP